MGLREPQHPPATRRALETDVVIKSTETAESRAFNEILAREGLKAALAWREGRLRQD